VIAALAATAVAAAVAAQVGNAAPSKQTPFPPIAAKKAECPKSVYTAHGFFAAPVTVVIAAQKGRHPAAALLACSNAYAIALAGKKYFQKFPFEHTGEKIQVGGATYTAAVGGPDVWPPTSGPVYGWFGNGIEVLLMIPSGP
jgi:hypothetical protein